MNRLRNFLRAKSSCIKSNKILYSVSHIYKYIINILMLISLSNVVFIKVIKTSIYELKSKYIYVVMKYIMLIINFKLIGIRKC